MELLTATVIIVIFACSALGAVWMFVKVRNVKNQIERGLMGSVEAFAGQSTNPQARQLLTSLFSRNGGGAAIQALMSAAMSASGTQSAAGRIQALEALHAQGQITDAKLAELKAAIQAEGPATQAAGPITATDHQADVLEALRKSGILSAGTLASITAAMGTPPAGPAAPAATAGPATAGAPASSPQEVRLAFVDDLHARKIVNDEQYAAMRAEVLKI